MPVLPIIDALILLGWSSLFGGMFLKAIYITTSYRPTFFGMHPADFLTVAAVALLFALALAGRTWVKHAEPEILARRRRQRLAQAGYLESEQPETSAPSRADGVADLPRTALRS
jgi:hypothetical protein